MTVTLPLLGNGSKFLENARGGATGGVDSLARTVVPAPTIQIAVWATPSSKLVVSVLPAKLALNPRAQAGVLAIALVF